MLEGACDSNTKKPNSTQSCPDESVLEKQGRAIDAGPGAEGRKLKKCSYLEKILLWSYLESYTQKDKTPREKKNTDWQNFTTRKG